MDDRGAEWRWLAERIQADAEMSRALKEDVIDAMARAWDAIVRARAAVARSRQILRRDGVDRPGAEDERPSPPRGRVTPESAA
jgi:hypothetical protein